MASMKMIQDARTPDAGEEMARAVLAWIAALTLSWGYPVSVAEAQTLPCGYTIRDVIQAAPGPFGLPSPTFGVAISPNGRWVCGDFNPGGIGYDRGFWFDTLTHEFHVLPVPSGVYQSSCNDVNDAGLMVGDYWRSTPPSGRFGFVFDINAQAYAAELPPLPGGAWCDATGINASNVVCGFRSNGIPGDPAGGRTAFRWTLATGFQDLGFVNGLATGASDIAPDGQISAYVEGHPNARIWAGEALIDLGPVPGGADSTAWAISSNGHVVGSGHTSVFGSDAVPFEHRNGTMRRLPVLSPEYWLGVAYDLNEAGSIVGACRRGGSPSNWDWRGCIWAGGSVADLNLMSPLPSGTVIETAGAIAISGRICAAGHNDPTHVISFVLDPVPRPAGDTNCDQVVNVTDLLAVVISWGNAGGVGDCNGDSLVDVTDLLIVIINWSG